MKILWISPTPPIPINAGNRRHLSYLIESAEKHTKSIDFILYGWENEAKKHISDYRAKFSNFLHFPQPTNKVMSHLNYWGIDDWISNDFIEFVRRSTKNQKYDAVITEYVWTSKILDIFPSNTVRIIDTHDIFTDRDILLEKQGIDKQWFYTSREQEKIGLSRADIILGITREDCTFFENLFNEDKEKIRPTIIHCGTGVKEHLKPQDFPKESTSLKIGYIGSSNALNKKSIIDFIEKLSNSTKKSKNFHINIGGSICSHIPETKNIKIYKKGYIADIKKFYADIDIIIAPMVEGTGLKIKSIEAIEHNKPLIATTYATNDLPVRSALHSFRSINIMAKYIGTWLDEKSSNSERHTTINYLQGETSRILQELTESQKKTEDSLWKEIAKQVSIKNQLKPQQETHCTLKAYSLIKDSPPPKETREFPSSKKVSIIIAAYNTENYISNCLDSILQDRLEDFEIIVINDGSTDKTGLILEQYKSKYNTIKVVNQKNLGQGIARNKGIEISSGEYLYFIDSDDTISKNSLYNMYEMSKSLNLDICSPNRPYLNSRPLEFVAALTGWCCFVKRSILESPLPIRQPPIRSGQDGVFANMLLTRCQRAAVCEEADYFYEKRTDSTFNSLKKDTSAIPGLVEEHITTLRQFYEDSGISDTQAARYLLFLQDETFKWRLMANINELNKSDAERIYLAIKSELIYKLPKVQNSSLKYFDKLFLSIAQKSFSEFTEHLYEK